MSISQGIRSHREGSGSFVPPTGRIPKPASRGRLVSSFEVFRGDVAVPPCWQLFPHGADVGVRGVGTSQEEAFEQAALALTGVITHPARVRPVRPIRISCEAPDDELLLVDWLNALIYEMATRNMLFGRFHVRIHGRKLSATVWGEPVDPLRHEPAVEVKGATYTCLRVKRQGPADTWIAQCVVDV